MEEEAKEEVDAVEEAGEKARVESVGNDKIKMRKGTDAKRAMFECNVSSRLQKG